MKLNSLVAFAKAIVAMTLVLAVVWVYPHTVTVLVAAWVVGKCLSPLEKLEKGSYSHDLLAILGPIWLIVGLAIGLVLLVTIFQSDLGGVRSFGSGVSMPQVAIWTTVLLAMPVYMISDWVVGEFRE